MNRFGNHRPPRSRGAILVVLVVLVAVASVLSAAILRTALLRSQAVQSEARRVQAVWLAESGVERAAARLAADSKYAGETWNLAPEVIGGPDPAAVKIEVSAVAERPDSRLVRVQADYPVDPQQRARITKEQQIDLQRK
jgi:Tfp pilus assembly protein PilX